jgi:hypothetical protein
MWKPTISVSFEDNTVADDCLEFSAGSTSASCDCYEPEAAVPRGPWRAASSEEIQVMLSRNAGEDAGRSIRIHRFPSGFLEALRHIASRQGGLTPENARSITSSREAKAILTDFNRFASSLPSLNGLVTADHIHGGFYIKQPGLKTVTTNQDGRFIGLHVDNWFRLPIGRRAQSPVRICANFGSCDRFLLFLNVTVDDIYSADAVETQDGKRLEWRKAVVNLKTPTILARKFLRVFDYYPITRIRVKPGEAYIAPTENIVHDASTELGSDLDVSCHIINARSGGRTS